MIETTVTRLRLPTARVASILDAIGLILMILLSETPSAPNISNGIANKKRRKVLMRFILS